MDRRQFLQFMSLALAGGATASCTAGVTPRMVRPEKLTQSREKLQLVNASIVDVERGRLRPERSLLLSDGKIAALGDPGGEIQADRTVDLENAYVIPGLINAHCHMTMAGGIGFAPGLLMALRRQLERGAEECVRHGVTTVRDMLAIGDWLESLKDKISRQLVIGPRIHTCCAISVDGGYGDSMSYLRDERFFKIADTPIQAADAVKAAFDEGADFIKLFQQPQAILMPIRPLPVMDLPSMRAIVNEAEKQGRSVALHQAATESFFKGLEAGVTCFEHVVRNRDLNDEEIRRIQDYGRPSVPTLAAPFGLAHDRRGDPYWKSENMERLLKLRRKMMPWLIREFCEPEFVEASLDFFHRLSDPMSYERRHIVPWPDQKVFTSAVAVGTGNAMKLYDAGLPMGCGNDGGVPFAFSGALALEMLLMELAGMKPADVLCSATATNAHILGLEKEVGTIEIGKIADLAVFDNNPLATARHLFRPRMVFQDGQLSYLASSS